MTMSILGTRFVLGSAQYPTPKEHTLGNDNDNDMTMEVWPYRQECGGHDPSKKKSVALMRLAQLTSCALKHY